MFFKFLRSLYDWVLHWAYTPYGALLLFIIAFAEASFFPIPPDILLSALCLSRSRKALLYALICSLGSILGGMFGYFIGWAFWDSVGYIFFDYVPGFTKELFNSIKASYEAYNFWVVFTAGFTPVPYKIITISAGAFSVDFPIFVLASVISRSARFFLISVLLYYFGDPIYRFIDRYFNMLTIVALVLLVGIYLAFRIF